MFNRVWNLSSRNEFAAKLRKKTGGAFFNFPRFAAAHCTKVKSLRKQSVEYLFPLQNPVGRYTFVVYGKKIKSPET